MGNRVVVSLSGVQQTNLDQCARFADELPVPVSLLVRPVAMRGVAGWLASRVAGGDCAVLHGLGGLSGMPGHETGLRLVAINAMLEQLAMPVSCFAVRSAPRGMRDALRRFGFRACADVAAVYDLVADLAHPGRLIDLGRGEQWRRAAALLAAGRVARRSDRVLRLSADVGVLGNGGAIGTLRAAVDSALRNGARPATLLDLASPVPPRRPVNPAPDESLWSQTA